MMEKAIGPHFKQRYLRYAKACAWSPEQCFHTLSWCLSGKAADYSAVVLEREDLNYWQLLDKLENRFGLSELSETARSVFVKPHSCRTSPLESGQIGL